MRVTQAQSCFKPVKIVLENEEEVKTILSALGLVVDLPIKVCEKKIVSELIKHLHDSLYSD
jgi:hypothetical protein